MCNRYTKRFSHPFLSNHDGVRPRPVPAARLQHSALLPIHPLSRLVHNPLVHPARGCVCWVSPLLPSPSRDEPHVLTNCTLCSPQPTKIPLITPHIPHQLVTTRVCPRSLNFASIKGTRRQFIRKSRMHLPPRIPQLRNHFLCRE